MLTTFSGGGEGRINRINLPAFRSIVLEVAIKVDPAWTSDVDSPRAFFALGIDGGDLGNGHAITIWNSGRIDGDNKKTNNNPDGGGAIPADSWTVYRIEWDAGAFTIKRNGVAWALPEPHPPLPGAMINDASACFSFWIGGGGTTIGYLDYFDVQGSGDGDPLFWTNLLGTRENVGTGA